MEKHGSRPSDGIPATKEELDELMEAFPDRPLTKAERARFKAYKEK